MSNVASVLTEGLTADEEAREAKDAGEGYNFKSIRESTFPLRILKQNLACDVRQANATRAEDRTNIMHALVGHSSPEELGAPPPDDHPNYDIVNQYLRSTLARAALPNVDSAEELSPFVQALGE